MTLITAPTPGLHCFYVSPYIIDIDYSTCGSPATSGDREQGAAGISSGHKCTYAHDAAPVALPGDLGFIQHSLCLAYVCQHIPECSSCYLICQRCTSLLCSEPYTLCS